MLSRRAPEREASLPTLPPGGSLLAVSGVTGVTHCRESGWIARMDGYLNRSTWRKLHLSTDAKAAQASVLPYAVLNCQFRRTKARCHGMSTCMARKDVTRPSKRWRDAADRNGRRVTTAFAVTHRGPHTPLRDAHQSSLVARRCIGVQATVAEICVVRRMSVPDLGGTLYPGACSLSPRSSWR